MKQKGKHTAVAQPGVGVLTLAIIVVTTIVIAILRFTGWASTSNYIVGAVIVLACAITLFVRHYGHPIYVIILLLAYVTLAILPPMIKKPEQTEAQPNEETQPALIDGEVDADLLIPEEGKLILDYYKVDGWGTIRKYATWFSLGNVTSFQSYHSAAEWQYFCFFSEHSGELTIDFRAENVGVTYDRGLNNIEMDEFVHKDTDGWQLLVIDDETAEIIGAKIINRCKPEETIRVQLSPGKYYIVYNLMTHDELVWNIHLGTAFHTSSWD